MDAVMGWPLAHSKSPLIHTPLGSRVMASKAGPVGVLWDLPLQRFWSALRFTSRCKPQSCKAPDSGATPQLSPSSDT